MGLLDTQITVRRPSSRKTAGPATAQMRYGESDVLGNLLNEYTPLQKNLKLYETIRESIPPLDIAIIKLMRMAGGFELIAENKDTQYQEFLDIFKARIPVGDFNFGLQAYVDELGDSALESGYCAGEIIIEPSLDGINRLRVGNPNELHFIRVPDSPDVVLGAVQRGQVQPKPFPFPEYIDYLAFDTRKGDPRGYSLIYSTINAAQVYLRWQKSFENQTVRFGDPSLFGLVTGGLTDQGATSQEDINEFQASLQEALATLNKYKKLGQTADITLGLPANATATIKAIGSDAKFIVSTDLIRMIMEMIVTKTGIPPYELGFSWGTTETMSRMQENGITTYVTRMRDKIGPILIKIINLGSVLHGFPGKKFVLEWEPVILSSDKDRAETRKIEAETNGKIIENLDNMILLGWTDKNTALHVIESNNMIEGKKMPTDWWERSQERGQFKTLMKTILAEAA